MNEQDLNINKVTMKDEFSISILLTIGWGADGLCNIFRCGFLEV